MAEEAEAALYGGGGDLGGGGAQHLLHRRLLRSHIAEEGRWRGGGGVGRLVAGRVVWCVLRRPRTGQPRAGLGEDW